MKLANDVLELNPNYVNKEKAIAKLHVCLCWGTRDVGLVVGTGQRFRRDLVCAELLPGAPARLCPSALH